MIKRIQTFVYVVTKLEAPVLVFRTFSTLKAFFFFFFKFILSNRLLNFSCKYIFIPILELIGHDLSASEAITNVLSFALCDVAIILPQYSIDHMHTSTTHGHMIIIYIN